MSLFLPLNKIIICRTLRNPNTYLSFIKSISFLHPDILKIFILIINISKVQEVQKIILYTSTETPPPRFNRWRRKRQPTPVFLPGESQGRGSLVGWRLWGRTESDMTEVTYWSDLAAAAVFGCICVKSSWVFLRVKEAARHPSLQWLFPPLSLQIPEGFPLLRLVYAILTFTLNAFIYRVPI